MTRRLIEILDQAEMGLLSVDYDPVGVAEQTTLDYEVSAPFMISAAEVADVYPFDGLSWQVTDYHGQMVAFLVAEEGNQILLADQINDAGSLEMDLQLEDNLQNVPILKLINDGVS